MLICCIRLLWDWSFRLYYHITYICCFVVSYLFLLWYGWFLWCCFVLLLGEIQLFIIIIVLIISSSSSPCEFFTHSLADGLSLESEWQQSLQVSRNLLSILAELSIAVVWMVSTRPSISNPSRPLTKPLRIVPRAPITIEITVTLMFHSFFSRLARYKYLSMFPFSFYINSMISWNLMIIWQ